MQDHFQRLGTVNHPVGPGNVKIVVILGGKTQARLLLRKEVALHNALDAHAFRRDDGKYKVTHNIRVAFK